MGVDASPCLYSKHQEYVQFARLAFAQLTMACANLSEPLEVTVRAIGGAEFKIVDTQWRTHPECKVAWDWQNLLDKHRKKPKKIEAAFYSHGVLCGLMYARVSRGTVSVNVRYIEGSPWPDSPLKGFILTVALMQAELFAVVIKAKQVAVSRPAAGLIERYKEMRFELTEADKRLDSRGVKPRYHQLIRNIA
ncbi:hypothetical protein D3C81_531410 [compost metagenome]